ncbi:hypothetical protein JTB14_013336 [Gonioctena quinquepunctata]|nr:hypothetical protein JTB14_013336 [Gonioctena quinquepunctata]
MKLSHCLIILCAIIALSRANKLANYTVTNRLLPSQVSIGVATAAYQIEGAWNIDGKGEQIWDTFLHQHPEKVVDGSNGDIASDSYHHYKEDVEAMKTVGVNYYRFSIAWSRILPDGTNGYINQAGVDYYVNLFEELQANGIDAMVTLYHWDLPTALENQGGWLNPQIVFWFEEYARICYQLFGKYVKTWTTINEPKQICHAGYGLGLYAPGVVSPGVGEYVCAKHLLLAHARAWRLFDAQIRPVFNSRNSMVMDSDWYEPATNSPQDVAAAESKRQFVYGMYAHPLVFGNWPQVMIDNIARNSQAQGFTESRLPAFSDEEINLIKGTYDFLTLNHYVTFTVRALEGGNVPGVNWDDDSGANTDYNSLKAPALGQVAAWGFGRMLRWIKQTYGDVEIQVTENGTADSTGTLTDQSRIDYLMNYMSEMIDAIYDGVNVTSYTVWSIIDNFEWLNGYITTTGIYHVNMQDPNRQRLAKDSSRYLAKVIQTRCLLDQC